ncbi:unnamed protein product [Choristocarpus tenellus]
MTGQPLYHCPVNHPVSILVDISASMVFYSRPLHTCFKYRVLLSGGQVTKGTLDHREEEREQAPTSGPMRDVHDSGVNVDYDHLMRRLRAAETRERELHQHLFFHLQEKDTLVQQLSSIKGRCQHLQAQINGDTVTAKEPSKQSSGSTTRGSLGSSWQEVDLPGACSVRPSCSMSSATNLEQSLPMDSFMDNVAHVENILDHSSDVTTRSKPVPAAKRELFLEESGMGVGALPEGSVDVEHKETSPVRRMPEIEIPLLLEERGGHILISTFWEAYCGRFGKSPFSSRELFGMIKAGDIPRVVHEPPASICLSEPYPPPRALVTNLESSGDLGTSTPVTAGDVESTLPSCPLPTPTPDTDPSSSDDSTTISFMSTSVGEERVGISSGMTQQVDWEEVTKNMLDVLEDGPLSSEELLDKYSGQSHKLPNLRGHSLKTAVVKGMLKGICFDRFLLKYNLTTRVLHQRQASSKQSGTMSCKSERSSESKGLTDQPPSTSTLVSDGKKQLVDWEKLNEELMTILADGPMLANELHQEYVKKHKKPPYMDKRSYREAVRMGLLPGIAQDRSTRGLKLA